MINIVKFLLTGLIGTMAMLTLTNIVYAEEGNFGETVYINGGIGEEDSSDIKAKAGDYNLRLYLSEGKRGRSITDVTVNITDKKGNVRLDLPNGGPLLFLKLEKGSYNISAQHNGVTLTRKVVIANRRGENVYLNWKSTDEEAEISQEQ